MVEQGTVKWYSIAKGYGFVIRDGGGDEIFVHYSAVDPESLPLAEGDRVSLEVARNPKGLRGRDIRRLAANDDDS